MEVKSNLIMIMFANCEIAINEFEIDQYEILLKKYKNIKNDAEFIDKETLKLLDSQIEDVISRYEKRKMNMKMLEMVNSIVANDDDKPKTDK